ncbi:PA14 domain-containing protein [Bacillus sp. CECT 9360]|uniref:beta-xylosidase family glycoside hydrolase n=1 Tax=Bacillus sp. CECT 9360 TaxID=2845821 RepID=UPI001E380163|nr:PA14 domain-containing protein [Bacillus sp. CECT 9360]CAH0343903.1 Beta-galactosidase [Bacillus sp. CECT 9360]
MKKSLVICFLTLTVAFVLAIGLNAGPHTLAKAENDVRPHGLKGEYYKSSGPGKFDFHELKTTIVDYDLNFTDLNPVFDLFTGQNDNTAARWTGKIVPEHSEDYTFYMIGDNGFRVWIDGKLAIDFWQDKWDIEQKSAPISLEAGKEYDIKVEYFEHFGGANLKLFWSSDSVKKQIVPSSAFYLPDGYGANETVKTAQVLKDGKHVELKFNHPLAKLPANLKEHLTINLNGNSWEIKSFSLKKNDPSTLIIETAHPIYERTGNQVLVKYDGKGGIFTEEGSEIPNFLNRVQNFSQFNIKSPWADKVKENNVLPEYPRPQMKRDKWLNLNGKWEFQAATEGESVPNGKKLNESILVPFAVETALSGVERSESHMWYKRNFTIPKDWKKERIKLNFGAVDWKTNVYVNGKKVGEHIGGYDTFSFDITDHLVKGNNELIVEVYDPTSGGQARGKQTTNPEGIWYTPTSGIWQTVWLEPVSEASIESVKTVTDIHENKVNLTVKGINADGKTVEAIVYQKGKKVGTQTGKAGETFVVSVPKPRLWTTEDPFLYDVKINLKDGNNVVDTVESYFGMREISLGKVGDKLRPLLNGEFVFQIGPLDQGYWPDGGLTAPTDEALKFDIEKTKDLGFNMIRKHIKVEPERWYYWADKMGMIVWQDMPSMEGSGAGARKTPEDLKQFEHEFKEMIQERYNHPSIVLWTVFNEGWGQYDTVRMTNWVKSLDPTRLVSNASGWTDERVGDVLDWHTYPNPRSPRVEENRIAVIGEYGGLGLSTPGHEWGTSGWSYANKTSKEEVTDTYIDYTKSLKSFIHNEGLSAAVYTQTTDVEGELNGLLTYDRKVTKVLTDRIREANQSLIKSASSRYVLLEKIQDASTIAKKAKEGTDPGEYPEAAIKSFKRTIGEAYSVYSNKESTIEQHFNTIDKLNKAIADLKYEMNPPIEKGASIDHFEQKELGNGWSIFHDNPDKWNLTENPDSLTITAQQGDSHEGNNSIKNVFLQDAPAGDFEITTKLNASVGANHEQTGLYVWQDEDNYIRFGHVWDNGLKLETAKEEGTRYSKAQNIVAHPGGDTVYLKIKKTGNVYSTFFWNDGNWHKASDPITSDISSSKIGLYAASPGSGKEFKAKFDYFTWQE